MKASPAVPFTTLAADTILEHGALWAWCHYRKSIPLKELAFFWGTPPVLRARQARRAYVSLCKV